VSISLAGGQGTGNKNTVYLNVIHVHELIDNLCNKTSKYTNVKVIILHTIHQNSDMFDLS
jgi:hypothetical protein